MNHREVMQQAPEALEAMTTARCGGDDGMDISPINDAYDKAEAATTSLRAALVEQPEPPPEAQTEAEQRAYTFGWFKALEKSREMQEALQIIATPQRPDGTWNRDREACRQLAAEALGFHNKGGRDE